MSFTEFRNILYCLGYIPQLRNHMRDLQGDLWNLLTGSRADILAIKAQSLFNFLCYMHNIEEVVSIDETEIQRCLYNNQNVIHNEYGYLINGVFYI